MDGTTPNLLRKLMVEIVTKTAVKNCFEKIQGEIRRTKIRPYSTGSLAPFSRWPPNGSDGRNVTAKEETVNGLYFPI